MRVGTTKLAANNQSPAPALALHQVMQPQLQDFGATLKGAIDGI
jgi:hypothetical protein